jgi:hypothetical protein
LRLTGRVHFQHEWNGDCPFSLVLLLDMRGGKECGSRHYVRSSWYMVRERVTKKMDGWFSFFAKTLHGFLCRLTEMVTSRFDLTHILHLLLLNLFSLRWFAPDEATGFCSKAVTDSGMRASTYSLGSICLGSLLTAILQVSRFGLQVTYAARQLNLDYVLTRCFWYC